MLLCDGWNGSVEVETYNPATGAWTAAGVHGGPPLHDHRRTDGRQYLEVTPGQRYRVTVRTHSPQAMAGASLYIDGKPARSGCGIIGGQYSASYTWTGWQRDIKDALPLEPFVFAPLPVLDAAQAAAAASSSSSSSSAAAAAAAKELGTIRVEVRHCYRGKMSTFSSSLSTAAAGPLAAPKKAIEKGVGTTGPTSFGATTATFSGDLYTGSVLGGLSLQYRDRTGLLLEGVIKGADDAVRAAAATAGQARLSGAKRSAPSGSSAAAASSSSASAAASGGGGGGGSVAYVSLDDDGNSSVALTLERVTVTANDGAWGDTREVLVPVRPKPKAAKAAAAAAAGGKGKGGKGGKAPAGKKARRGAAAAAAASDDPSDSDSDIELVGEFNADGKAVAPGSSVVPPSYSMAHFLAAVETAFAVGAAESQAASAHAVGGGGAAIKSQLAAEKARVWDTDGALLATMDEVMAVAARKGTVVVDTLRKRKFVAKQVL